MDPVIDPGKKPDPVTPPTPVAPPVVPPVEPEDELIKLIKADPGRTADEIRTLRKEAADNRRKATEAEAKRQEAEDKKLAEQGEYKALAEKRETELAEFKANAKEDRIKSAVLLEATKAHIADPEDAYVLANLSKVDISETGVIAGVVEAVAELVKAKPYLVQAGTVTTTTAPNIRPTNPGGGPALTPDGLRNMTQDEIARMGKESLHAALAKKG